MFDQLLMAVMGTGRRLRRNPTIPKAPTKTLSDQLKDNNQLFFQLYLAQELHMTLGDLRERITEEEMELWSAYFQLRNKQQEEQQALSRRR